MEVGKVQTIKVLVKKLNFPRIKNLPNKVICEDKTGKINIIYFNSREAYIRKIFPVNKWVIISGKVSYFRDTYQISNPDYVTAIENKEYVVKNIPKYNLTKGINEKKYRKISEKIINNIPIIEDWLPKNFIELNNLLGWNEAMKKLHSTNQSKDIKSKSYRRLVFDEICANFLTLSENRKRIKNKKKIKIFDNKLSNSIENSLSFKLTNSQIRVLNEINTDLKSSKRMFRVMQGDVGSGKTIVSFLCVANVIESKYQCALMAPTEILANQHFILAKKIFDNFNIKVEFLTSKTEKTKKTKILKDLKAGKIDFLIGTHSLFQKR